MLKMCRSSPQEVTHRLLGALQVHLNAAGRAVIGPPHTPVAAEVARVTFCVGAQGLGQFVVMQRVHDGGRRAGLRFICLSMQRERSDESLRLSKRSVPGS